ncbi:protein JINGUBANG-like [Cucurbita maxima]|uniref:Protein JINGUBANG-like n=1 Tax=Cucurbita maxima TaxID=3661 RepID=A0A6J1IWL1_CUCMA|nr:protein JINGUBANG-like [Cucurbita maxima]
MESHLWTSIGEQTKSIDLPQNDAVLPDPILFPTSPARPSSAPVPTPWAMSSPPRTNQQPFVYHCIASLHRPDGNILSIAMTKEFIYVGSESGRIQSWKLQECPGVGFIKASSGQVGAMFACGRMLFSSHGDYRVRIWEVKMGNKRLKPKKISTLPPKRSLFVGRNGRRQLQQHSDHISCLAYNDADKLLYTGSWDSTVKAWNISENRCVDSFVAHEGHVNAIVINQEDGCVFTCSSDTSVKIWRRVYGESSHILTMILKFQLSPVNALALSLLSSSSKPCNFLYSGYSDGHINFWEKESSSSRYNHGGLLQGHHFAVLCLVTVKDLILSGSEDTAIRIWRREERGNGYLHWCLSVIEGHHGPVRCLAAGMEMDNMGNMLVCSASLDQSFKVWRVKLFPPPLMNRSEMNVEQLKKEIGGCEMNNPVLSPSWVEKRKLQFDDYYVSNNNNNHF